MNVYLDTSALVKLYVEEAESDDMAELVAAAEGLWTSVTTYAEARSAFGRKLRERKLGADDHQQVLVQLDQDWPHLHVINIDQAVGRAAGALSTLHGLRGFDAVQLACALYAWSRVDELIVATYDPALAQAAQGETLDTRGWAAQT